MVKILLKYGLFKAANKDQNFKHSCQWENWNKSEPGHFPCKISHKICNRHAGDIPDIMLDKGFTKNMCFSSLQTKIETFIIAGYGKSESKVRHGTSHKKCSTYAVYCIYILDRPICRHLT